LCSGACEVIKLEIRPPDPLSLKSLALLMAVPLKPDLCIIGAGSAGLGVAERARAHGASVVLVERADMGGQHLNTADMPSKALVAAARLSQRMRHAGEFGFVDTDPRASFRAVARHVDAVVEGVAPQDSEARFLALGVEIVRADARFIDPRTVVAGDQVIKARRFVIATGSRPFVPDIPGLDRVPYFTADTLFANERKLTHLVIIGGGPMAIELGQAFVRLGSQVTIVARGQALSRFDPELADIVLRRLRHEGVDLREVARVTEIEPRSQGIGVVVTDAQGETERLDASHILVAAGRRPDFDGLDIDKARIKRHGHDPHRLYVSAGMKTSNRRVYVIGDAAGGPMFTHAADYHAGLIVRAAVLGLPARQKPGHLPRTAYAEPEIAEVGLNEAELRRRRQTDWRVLRVALAESERLGTSHEAQGVARMIVDAKGRILGAGVVGGHAGETIALFALAVARGLKVSDLADFVPAYPTESALVRRLVDEYYRDRLESPLLRRLAQLVRILP
jgi:pyruvate/2-oxoglutarate dehydrogenase complex dihydrolipoamide dehydrogenase (E3) component